MAKSRETYSKKEKQKNSLKKRLEKQQKKEERKASSQGGGLENMMAYVDEYGNISDTPPDPSKKKKINPKTIEVSVSKKEKEEFDPIRNGKIEYFNDQKGFGFIKDLQSQEKYFVHVKGMIDDVREGDKVIFELEKGMKGLNAVRVKRA